MFERGQQGFDGAEGLVGQRGERGGALFGYPSAGRGEHDRGQHVGDELARKVVDQVQDLLKSFSLEETVRQRDDILLKLLALKAKANQLP